MFPQSYFIFCFPRYSRIGPQSICFNFSQLRLSSFTSFVHWIVGRINQCHTQKASEFIMHNDNPSDTYVCQILSMNPLHTQNPISTVMYDGIGTQLIILNLRRTVWNH